MSRTIPVSRTIPKIVTVIGTRPEIIKLAPLIERLDSAAAQKRIEHIIIHTGQHYDYEMDAVFFEELQLRKPDFNLNVGAAAGPALPGKQTAMMIEKIEQLLLQHRPQCVIVEGDTNSVLAGCLAAAKLGIKVLHLEAGCRCRRKIPEEINRIVADHVADVLIAPDRVAYDHLKREGISMEKVSLFPNTIFESVRRARGLADAGAVLKKFGVERGAYILMTLHRQENTSEKQVLEEILSAINEVSKTMKVLFPVHPRTKAAMEQFGLTLSGNVKQLKPQPYLSMVALMANAYLVMTDSGGMQQEAFSLNTPCFVLRDETEWTAMLATGKNRLIGSRKESILEGIRPFMENPAKIQELRDRKVPKEFAVDEDVSDKIAALILDSVTASSEELQRN